MENLNALTLFAVIIVNIILIMATCVLSTGTVLHPNKRNIVVDIVLLSINFIFDIVSLIWFLRNNMADNAVVFVLFLPLTGFLLFECIKEEIVLSKKKKE